MRTVVLRGTGQEDRGQWSIMEASGKVLFIFSQNDWWMPTLLFLCGDSHSSHQRSQQKILHFPLQRRVSSVPKFLLTPPHRYRFLPAALQSIFRRSNILILAVLLPYMASVWKLRKSITVKPKTELTRENNHHGASLKNQTPEKCWHKMENRSERHSDENWCGTSQKKKKIWKCPFLKRFIFHFLHKHIDQVTRFGERSNTGNNHTSCFWAFSKHGR